MKTSVRETTTTASSSPDRTMGEKHDHEAYPEKGIGSVLNADDLRLQQMGYKQELTRNFSFISCLAVGFSISNTVCLDYQREKATES